MVMHIYKPSTQEAKQENLKLQVTTAMNQDPVSKKESKA